MVRLWFRLSLGGDEEPDEKSPSALEGRHKVLTAAITEGADKDAGVAVGEKAAAAIDVRR